MDNPEQHNPQHPRRPQTIEDLKEWYASHNLPPEEVTRFFIGKNITEPKAFGIYRDEAGEIVVYKNKANGERAIRYQGRDEQYAVQELLDKLKEEVARRKGSSAGTIDGAPQEPSVKEKRRKKGCIITTILIGLFGGALIIAGGGSGIPDGYYNYNGQQYYLQGAAWYMFDAIANEWIQATQSPEDFITKENAQQYRTNQYDGKRFEDSKWYEPDNSSWDDDDDYNWDSDDDWDSDDSDWDSDW